MARRRAAGLLPVGLALALLLCGTSSASAFNTLVMLLDDSSAQPGLVDPGDVVIVDVYLFGDSPGMEFLSVAVLLDDDGILTYDPGASTMPPYILYSPAVGTSPTRYLVPANDPPDYWNGINVPGKRQINIEYLEHTLGTSTAVPNYDWLATLVFDVSSMGPGSTTLELTLDAGGTIVQAYSNDVAGSTVTTGSFTFIVPEPGTAMLIATAVLASTVATRRRRSRSTR